MFNAWRVWIVLHRTCGLVLILSSPPVSHAVLQVMKVQQTIVAKCPNLAVPYRRLVCYCRLYEVTDPSKKDRPGE